MHRNEALFIKRDSYVDDLLGSVHTEKETEKLISTTNEILQTGDSVSKSGSYLGDEKTEIITPTLWEEMLRK